MNQLARKTEPVTALQEVGAVLRLDGELVVARLGDAEVTCRRAASCLLAAEPGDTVLVASTSRGESWVLAVLERDGEARARLEVEGGLDLRVRNGELRVAADGGATLVTERRVGVVSAGVDVHTEEASVSVGTLNLLGRLVRAETEAVQLVAERVDSWVTRISQRAERVYRVVEDFEQLRARRVDHRVTTHLSVQAENATLAAKELVRLDGSQIHLG